MVGGTSAMHSPFFRGRSEIWVDRLWEQAEAASRAGEPAQRQGGDVRGLAVRARAAWKKAATAFQRYEDGEAAWKLAEPVLSVFRPDEVTVTMGNATIVTLTRRLDVLPGDFNDNAGVNLQDVLLFRNKAQGITPAALFGDINRDGVEVRGIRREWTGSPAHP